MCAGQSCVINALKAVRVAAELNTDDQSGSSKGLAAYVVVILKSAPFILRGTALTALVGVLISFALPASFTAIAKIYPPQQSQSTAVAILSQLTAAGAGTAVGARTQSDLFASMIRSRTVADELIDKFNLRQIYGTDLYTVARLRLDRRTKVIVGKDGIITIEVEDQDPKRAADLANGYIAGLEHLTQSISITEASQRRLFFEKQLDANRKLLTDAETRLLQFQISTGLIAPSTQASASVGASVALRAQLTAKELELEATKTFGTESNPNVKRIQAEIGALRQQLAQLEKAGKQSSGDVLITLSRVPEATQEYVSLSREVRFREAMQQVLFQQLETARLDEAKNATLIQVIDKAEMPEQRSWPKRKIIVGFLATAAFLSLLAWVCTTHYVRLHATGTPYISIAKELRELLGGATRFVRRRKRIKP
jgi:tyrosine-protein kinase Etk/Wzc